MTNVSYLGRTANFNLHTNSEEGEHNSGSLERTLRTGVSAVIVTVNTDLFKQYFEGHIGKRIFVYSTAREGIDAWSSRPTTHFFCGLRSLDNGWTGFKLCRHISNNNSASLTNVFVMAEKWDEGDRRWVQKCGGSGIVLHHPENVIAVLSADTSVNLGAMTGGMGLSAIDTIFHRFMGPASRIFIDRARELINEGSLEPCDYARYLGAQLSDQKHSSFLRAVNECSLETQR